VLIALDEAREGIAERIDELKREDSKSDYDQDRISERIAKLAGGLCVMRVGGPTEFVLKERRARVEDALGAVRSALEEGVVPGAGSAYLSVAECLQDREDLGTKCLVKALKAPLIKLADNAGQEGSSIVHYAADRRKSWEDGWIGWDVMKAEFRDLSEDPPIIDPVGVVKAVIEAAASVTATLLTAEASVADA
jgi:chaperonin GroEL